MYKLAIFASGSGTNAENIIHHFRNHQKISVSCICSNRPDAYVIHRAKQHEIPFLVFSKHDFYESEHVLGYLKNMEVDWVILAGFLWLIPMNMINRYRNRILNIHPALLPKYGGKGMYGNMVHQAVISNGEPQSGITIHQVNEKYDEGNIVFQATCDVSPADTPETLASKVHELEYRYFPEVIEREILKSTKN
jgi:phosphoribosylglycinamide formyltransferase 1